MDLHHSKSEFEVIGTEKSLIMKMSKVMQQTQPEVNTRHKGRSDSETRIQDQDKQQEMSLTVYQEC